MISESHVFEGPVFSLQSALGFRLGSMSMVDLGQVEPSKQTSKNCDPRHILVDGFKLGFPLEQGILKLTILLRVAA